MDDSNSAAPVIMMKAIFLLIFFSSLGFAQTKPKTIVLSSYSLGVRLWQEKTSLADIAGKEYSLHNDFYGALVGYQRTYYQRGLSFRHEGYAFFGQLNTAADESSFEYFEKGLSVVGIGGSETLLWTTAKAALEYGITADIFFRQILMAQPSGGITVNDTQRFLFLVGPQVRWNIAGKTFLEQRLSYSPMAKDVIWNFSFIYRGQLW